MTDCSILYEYTNDLFKILQEFMVKFKSSKPVYYHSNKQKKIAQKKRDSSNRNSRRIKHNKRAVFFNKLKKKKTLEILNIYVLNKIRFLETTGQYYNYSVSNKIENLKKINKIILSKY